MLLHKGTATLKTKRLILREFVLDDAEDMFKNWANDERVTKFLTWKPHESEELTKKLLELWCKEYALSNNYNWAIDFNEELIGNVSVTHLSEENESAELGYCLAYNFWNKGIMTEAVNAVIDYLFSEVYIHRIGISHAVKNPGSGRVAQKCGFDYEGTKREYFKCGTGEFLDISDYGILRTDWEKRKNII